MEFKELIKKNRSYRRFYEDVPVELDTLKELVDIARLTPSANNMQPLKYILSADPQKNSLIFPCLAWAGYLKEWSGPVEGERPAAYVIILGDTEIRKSIKWDHSIAALSILLGAAEKDLGGCIMGAIDKVQLAHALKISSRYEILLTISLGKPRETVILDDVGKDEDIKYWRDKDDVHHVPKRPLDEIILDL
ncbi:MAG: nitroreductase family protein [bacterium]|nr:nitroreductase family protein [bacterium]